MQTAIKTCHNMFVTFIVWEKITINLNVADEGVKFIIVWTMLSLIINELNKLNVIVIVSISVSPTL